MANDDLSARLRATFLQELEDQVGVMEASLLSLEADPGDTEAVRSLFRAAHSIKGAARVTDQSLIEEACHALETLFAEVRDGERVLDGEDFSQLFALTDALGDAGRRLREGGSLADSPLAALLPRFRTGTLEPSDAGQNAGSGSAPAAGSSSDPYPAAETRSTSSRVRADDQPQPPVPRDATGEAPRPARPTVVPGDEDGPPPPPGDDANRRAPQMESVRVSAERLDELAAYATDLLTTSGSIADRPRELEALTDQVMRWSAAWRQHLREVPELAARERMGDLDRQLHQISARVAHIARESVDEARILTRTTDDLLSGIRTLRMRRIADAFEALPRAVRDLAAATGKQAELVVMGEDVEADRLVIDSLREPLLHLVRNAVDHGIETPAERRARGKPAHGTVRVTASLERGRLRIIVEDDGGGIDTDAVRRRIAARGEPVPEDGRSLARRLLTGGITTREEATNISGRGVGLDLIAASMERIGGAVDLRWRPGAFTRFTLDTPPSPTTLHAVIVEASDQLFALPIGQIERVVRIRAEEVREVEGRPALTIGDAPVPIAALSDLLGAPLRGRGDLADAPALVFRTESGAMALVVDTIAEEREVVVRPLDRRAHVPYVSGGALLPSGRVALVLIAAALLDAGLSREQPTTPIGRPRSAEKQAHLLVVDDSITTRTLEQSVLEAAGHRVTTAVDGVDAWDKLLRDTVDLIVSDVEMPRMTGFDLCRRVRATPRFAELPIILVTGMETAEDRALGLEVGADAYILKSSFDQTALLDTISQLIG